MIVRNNYTIKNSFAIICVYSFFTFSANAQQFVGDNQWVAPHGVFTLIGTTGQQYSQFDLVTAFLPEWEFNSQVIYYYEDPRTNTDSFINYSFFAKRRLFQNESETAGYAISGGVGLFPQHLDQGEVVNTFESWWVMGIATYAFANNTILLDILPGATVNLDHKQSNNTAWGFTYSTRIAVYKVIPQSAIVAEVFGTSGQANAPISYRGGVRWENSKWVVAATYSSAFSNSNGAGLEIGFMFFTDPLFGINKKTNKN